MFSDINGTKLEINKNYISKKTLNISRFNIKYFKSMD